MIRAQRDTPFEALASGAPAGLVGSITVQVYDPTDASEILAPTAVGITEPRAGSYRVSLTVPVIGSFMVRWEFLEGATPRRIEDELIVTETAPPEPSVLDPTVQEVADLLFSRTRTRGGENIGNFTADTNPTGERVERLITRAYEYVYGKLGVVTDPYIIADANRAVVLYTAMLVELGHYSEQVNTNRSPYREIAALFDKSIAALIESVGGEGGSALDDGLVEGVSDQTPNYAFPETSIGDGIMP